VLVANPQGSILANCRISDRVRPGVAWMPFGGWGDVANRACSVNALTPEEPTDWGGGSGFYDAFVSVEKACSVNTELETNPVQVGRNITKR
jgi:anaerobic selenocysteine-containing dehydrogenase